MSQPVTHSTASTSRRPLGPRGTGRFSPPPRSCVSVFLMDSAGFAWFHLSTPRVHSGPREVSETSDTLLTFPLYLHPPPSCSQPDGASPGENTSPASLREGTRSAVRVKLLLQRLNYGSSPYLILSTPRSRGQKDPRRPPRPLDHLEVPLSKALNPQLLLLRRGAARQQPADQTAGRWLSWAASRSV
ncbi:unnamed protein product [Pleuronectes platessa]|uniref:Uncharacterized protein n=1 Tax=Pleuronectes platessa TaxID=8262 RepID=A0A9N7Z2R9_PLEPL|nr:unnamed protein product [Pleuronectes platessa]